MIFPYLMSNWNCVDYFERFQNYDFLCPGQLFFLLEVSSRVWYAIQIVSQIPGILTFWSLLLIK